MASEKDIQDAIRHLQEFEEGGRYESLTQAKNCLQSALHSVEAEKEPEWTPESERHLEQQLTLLARLENSEARISELESLVRQYHVALSGAPGTSPCNCMTESSRPEDHQKICPVSVLSRAAPPEHKPE